MENLQRIQWTEKKEKEAEAVLKQERYVKYRNFITNIVKIIYTSRDSILDIFNILLQYHTKSYELLNELFKPEMDLAGKNLAEIFKDLTTDKKDAEDMSQIGSMLSKTDVIIDFFENFINGFDNPEPKDLPKDLDINTVKLLEQYYNSLEKMMPGEDMKNNRNSILVNDFAAKKLKTKEYKITKGNSEFVSVYKPKVQKPTEILHLLGYPSFKNPKDERERNEFLNNLGNNTIFKIIEQNTGYYVPVKQGNICKTFAFIFNLILRDYDVSDPDSAPPLDKGKWKN